jgi:zinc and cadmium transporter
MIDTRLGIITFLVEVLHEIPQELGDFGVLIKSGWKTSSALVVNALSALSFPLGALIIYFSEANADISLLLAFAAGNFLYISAADLVPELKANRAIDQVIQFGIFLIGISVMFALARN